MNKIAWITDSTACLPTEFMKKNNVFVFPMQIQFGDESFIDGKTINYELFYEKMSTTSSLPVSSQPSIGTMAKMYEEMKEQGYERGIAIHITSELSGTLSSSKMAAEMVGFPVECIDSKITSAPMRELLYQGIKLEERGKSYEEIVSYLRESSAYTGALLVVESLDQLHKGGRLSGAQAVIGNMLQIKPILTFKEGKVIPLEKVRTHKKALNRMMELFATVPFSKEKMLKVIILHSNCLEKAKEIQKEMKERYPDVSFELDELGSTIAVHTGIGTIGIGWAEL